MSKQDLTKSRWGIGFHYFSMLILLITFEWISKFNSAYSNYIFIVFFLGLLYWVASFRVIFGKTRWWKYVHQSSDKYDERELKVIGEAMRKAYSIFAIIVSVIFMMYALTEWTFNGLFASLVLYFAHILPASILKWQGYTI